MSVIHPGHLDAEGLNWGNWSCSCNKNKTSCPSLALLHPPHVRLCDLTPFYHFSKHLPSAEESSPPLLFYRSAFELTIGLD